MPGRVHNAHVLQRQRTKPVGEENEDECRARQRDEPPRTPSTGGFGDLQEALDEELGGILGTRRR